MVDGAPPIPTVYTLLGASSISQSALLDATRQLASRLIWLEGVVEAILGNDPPTLDFLTRPEADVRYTPLTHVTDLDPHPQYETTAEVAAQILAHAALADPHPLYFNLARGDARYLTNPYAPDAVFTGSVSALSFTQGALAVLDTGHTAAVDPHPVYLTAVEADAAYAPASLVARVAALESYQTSMTAHYHDLDTWRSVGVQIIP